MKTKFALRDFSGKPTAYYLVESEDVSKQAVKPVKMASHHIAILDASGSMYSDMDMVKSTVEKVFTAQEFNDPDQRVTLISYSSEGDCQIHFERVTVEDVLAPNSPHLDSIRKLRVRGLTGISQALVAAEALIQDDEVTGITLHSDGYANDPSPYAEGQQIGKTIAAIAGRPNVFCNTIAYRSYCDFNLLSSIANGLSGKCIQVQRAKEVYDALVEAQKLLSGQVCPTIEASLGDNSFITFVSRSAGKVLGGTETLMVRGLSADDDKTVHRYLQVNEKTYKAAKASEDQFDVMLAFSRVNIALGNLNVAKYAMVSTRVSNLYRHHTRALVASEVGAMAADVERFLFNLTSLSIEKMDDYGLGETGPSVLSVLKTLTAHKASLSVNIHYLNGGYQRRGLKRVAGTRDGSGTLTRATIDTKPKVDTEWVAVSGIEMNRDTATANIRLAYDVNLIDRETDNPIPEVAGIKLDLKDYRNYTVVSDGQVNIRSLPFRTSDKRCFADLKKLGVVEGDFDPETMYEIDLSSLPLVDYDQDFSSVPADDFTRLAKLTVLQKIVNGLTKEVSEAFTPEQVEALKKVHLSPALYFSPPTTNAYTDLDDAIAKGLVDTRLSYKIKIGNPEMRSVGSLASGNAYLQRRFTFTDEKGNEVKKPALPMWWDETGDWGVKKLSARTKLTPVDDLAYPIYEDFFGLNPNGAVKEVLGFVKLDAKRQKDVMDALSWTSKKDVAVEALKTLAREVSHAIDAIYAEHITPLAFFVGATGLVPDSFGATALTPDQFVAKHPGTKLAKAEKEATFYELPGGLVLTVFISMEHFTTEAGAKIKE